MQKLNRASLVGVFVFDDVWLRWNFSMRGETQRQSRRSFTPHFIAPTSSRRFLSSEFCRRAAAEREAEWYRQSQIKREEHRKSLAPSANHKRSRRKRAGGRKWHLLNSFSRCKAREGEENPLNSWFTKRIKRNASIPEPCARFVCETRPGYIYKLYAHSNRFNDFSELIVYVYAYRNKNALNKRIERRKLWDEH